MEHIKFVISQIRENLKVGDVVQLNVKNLYTAFAKDGECKLKHCEVLKDNQYYDIATEYNKFAYGNSRMASAIRSHRKASPPGESTFRTTAITFLS